MTQSDIEEAMYDLCRCFNVPIYLQPNLPYTEIKDERIVITVSDSQSAVYWDKCFVKINWCVPDYEGEEDSPKIRHAEKSLQRLYRGVGKHHHEYYHYSKESTGRYEEKDMRCHYANLTLLFKSQNFKNYD